ncbi:MAG TPA: diaminopimelate decarboxylase [Baekduia sp.]|nr:diaminopimelate decarboxylase [Baekduia sp.]
MATTQTSVSNVWPLGTILDADGVLQLGGCDARELAKTYGTPAYIVAEDDLRSRARRFLSAFAQRTDDYEVHFASKSFPATAVLRVFAEEGLACDVASGGELHLALNAGFDPKKVHLHGNAKSHAELQQALDAGIGDIVVDNHDELDTLIGLIPRGARQRILLRIAPGVSPDTHPKISTGGPNTKFGFNPQDAEIAIDKASASDKLDLDGLHFHIGSQILDLAPFRAALEAVSKLGDFRTYNMGGGLGVNYLDEQSAPEIEAYVEAKVNLMREILGPGKRIADEPGRALVAHSTVTLYTVQSVKHNVVDYVAVDGGMSDNLRPMLYDARYEAMVVGRTTEPTQPRHLAGKHCESSDILIHDAHLPDARPGDLVAIPVTGAYGHAMANNYNGQPRPPIVFVSGGAHRAVVRRETYDDLTRRDL